MSAWNTLLEALHSALIDELNQRLPDEKPVLGLPKRFPGFSLPSDKVSGFLAALVTLEGTGRGVAFVAIEPGLSNGGGLGAEAEERLWAAILKRAGAEFERRQLSVGFGPPRLGRVSLPSEMPSPRVLIWIPFGLLRGQVFLGVGAA